MLLRSSPVLWFSLPLAGAMQLMVRRDDTAPSDLQCPKDAPSIIGLRN